jgi:hypothetical protein
MSESISTPEELGMRRFEVQLRPAKGGGLEKAIYIDGEMLDWQVDLNSYMEAVKMGPAFMLEAQKSIAEHFVEAVSDTLGRKVTIEEIKTATKTGWI